MKSPDASFSVRLSRDQPKRQIKRAVSHARSLSTILPLTSVSRKSRP